MSTDDRPVRRCRPLAAAASVCAGVVAAAALTVQVSSLPEIGSGPIPRAGRQEETAARSQILVVAQDGSGQFRTIQSALDAISQDNRTPKTILIRNGTYREKIFIKSSHVAVVGEDRDKTVVQYAELRKNWRVDHPDDWGAAVVNIGDTSSDIFLGNLTVHNNYGRLHGDHDHQFAVRSGGIATRIVIVHAKIIADGGDTLSLWNTGNGMYYHADCDFEGWVDYVCPRGWCYITNSRFFGRNLTASIWHDGSRDKDQRFVIRRSSFDGVPGFPLGRNNRDGQFFLLDNRFSANMANRPIYRPSAESAYQWPTRSYFWNNQRESGNFAWFADNLESADGAPRAGDITPVWTFQGRWDPEETMPSVLPFTSTPRPEDGDRDVPVNLAALRWVGSRDAERYRVSFGTANPPPVRGDVSATRFPVGPLTPGTIYFWRVDSVAASGIIVGPDWSFRTGRTPLAVAGASQTTSPARPERPVPPSAAKSPTWRVRIVLVGDSTVTDKAGWGSGFKKRLGDRADCINLARNGRSSKSFIAEGHWTEALKARADYALIQFGHNDMPGKGPDRETDPTTTYRAYLGQYVDEAIAAGVTPIIVTPLTRRLFGPDGKIHSDLGDYAAAARAVAAEKGVAVIDLHARSVELLDRMGEAAAEAFNIEKADGTPDTTHLSTSASTAFGAIVADELMRLVPALAPYLK
ncbi:MAG: pectinesterase family protein [Acidobacteria bacterium]|nr:pectinesterase family protein [Acidobacteriota bacterium]